MSVSFSCHCEERQKPVSERRWAVLQRRCNHSAFNGYNFTPSDYSHIWCFNCGATGRTKAKYVDEVRDMTADEVRTGREGMALELCRCDRPVEVVCTSSGGRHETSAYKIECPKCGDVMIELPSNCSGRARDAGAEWNRIRKTETKGQQ